MGLFSRKIGLALGAGGSKGLVHIGVIKELVKNNIKIDYIAGTSIGSLIGGMYALTKDIEMIEEIAFKNDSKELFLDMFSSPTLRGGFFKTEKVLNFVNSYIGEDTLVQDTKIPFAAISTNILTAKTVAIKEGPLRTAIRASISIPILFQPVKYNGMVLIDGGSTDPVPTRIVKEMGAQKIIGVNLYAAFFPREDEDEKTSIFNVFNRLFDIFLYNNAKANMELADVQLNIPVRDISVKSLFENPQDGIAIGEEIARKEIFKLKRL